MRERTQALYGARSQLLGSAVTSPQAVAFFAPIGIFVVMSSFVGGIPAVIRSPQCWTVAIASQAAASLIVLAGGKAIDALQPNYIRLWRVLVILIAGGVRGLVMVWLIRHFELVTGVTQALGVRVPSSAWTTLVWLTIFGFLLQGARDYQLIYEQLIQEAVRLTRQTTSDRVTALGLLQWAKLREQIQNDADVARRLLNNGPELTDREMDQASRALDEGIARILDAEGDVSALTSPYSIKKLQWGSNVTSAFQHWAVPLYVVVPMVFGLVGIGAITRGSVSTAITFTTVLTVVLWGELLITRLLVKRFEDHAQLIFRVVILTMPLVLFLAAPITKLIFPEALPDPTGLIFALFLGPVLVVSITTMHHSALDRRFILDSLRSRLDDEVIAHLVDQEIARDVANDLEFFIHEGIESELVELSKELTIAAETHDQEVMRAAGEMVAARLSSMKLNSPWLEGSFGFSYIHEMTQAWSGLAEVTMDLPTEDTFSQEMWRSAALIVERITTEAVRHGQAPSIEIKGEEYQGELILKFTAEPKVTGNAKVAAELRQWLSEQVPGRWLFTHDKGKSEFLVRIAP